jgi:G:T/U-mismatch repair DNA glycosylase
MINYSTRYISIDICLGSNVVRLVRAKQTIKRKSSLDTLIEVVQKELLRVNEQTNALSSTSTYASKLADRTSQTILNRSILSTVLPSSHPASLTSQSKQSLKITRKHQSVNHYRRLSSTLNNNDRHQSIEHYSSNDMFDSQTIECETIDDAVRETVDKLVAITILNTAPFIVNMLTPVPNPSSTVDTKLSTHVGVVHVC